MRRITTFLVFIALLTVSALAFAQDSEDPPYECDDEYGECGTPEQSGGGGCGCGCAGSILVNNTDLGDTYQYADDYDNDGSEDPFDNCPFNRNIDQADSDGDGIGDACDSCVSDINVDQLDTDGDAIGDVCDPDIDGDNVVNENDICPLHANPLQTNTDGDAWGDACDSDDDNDGHEDLDDNCPLIPNPDQIMPADSAGCHSDQDGDGINDERDNCPLIHNPDQINTDLALEQENGLEELGDECDPDRDGDSVMNAIDNCPLVYNPSQIDEDHDQLGDGEEGSCDPAFCYVVLGDRDNCLDPDGAFRIYTPSLREVRTGEEVLLRLFSNREGGVAIEYRWTVEQAPGGSSAVVRNPYGSVNYADPFELHYAENNRATFVPDEPGEYILRVSATQVWADPHSGQLGETSEALAFIMVTGESLGDTGCSVAGSGARTGTIALLALFGLFIASRFRRS